MKGSNAHTIEQRIVAWKRGRIFFPSDFADIASDGSVRITLMRLSKEGMIVRLASGIYYYPEIDTEYGLGTLKPGPMKIAKAVAKHDKISIIPSGPYGLTCKVPCLSYPKIL